MSLKTSNFEAQISERCEIIFYEYCDKNIMLATLLIVPIVLAVMVALIMDYIINAIVWTINRFVRE